MRRCAFGYGLMISVFDLREGERFEAIDIYGIANICEWTFCGSRVFVQWIVFFFISDEYHLCSLESVLRTFAIDKTRERAINFCILLMDCNGTVDLLIFS